MTRVVGLDIGGTRSRAVLAEEGEVLAEAEGGAGNPAAIGLARARSNLSDLLERLPEPASVRAVCAGAAGADGPWAMNRLRSVLAELLPGARVRVVIDAHLPLAAAGLDEGVVVIAGTGSIAYGRSATGLEARAGGWGHLLGDEGSGYWFGREAVRSALSAHDSGMRPSPLHRAVLDHIGIPDLIDVPHRFHEDHRPDRWAALAPLVFEHAADDPDALAIIERAGEALALLAGRVRARLDDEDLPVVLAGGLLLGAPMLEAAARRRIPGRVIRLEARPVAGAAHLAERLLREGVSG